jgi:hypothetical protein
MPSRAYAGGSTTGLSATSAYGQSRAGDLLHMGARKSDSEHYLRLICGITANARGLPRGHDGSRNDTRPSHDDAAGGPYQAQIFSHDQMDHAAHFPSPSR